MALLFLKTTHTDQDETKTRLNKIEANETETETRLSEKFSSETRPRRDNLQNFVRDRDETESLGTFSLETETRPRLSPISVCFETQQSTNRPTQIPSSRWFVAEP